MITELSSDPNTQSDHRIDPEIYEPLNPQDSVNGLSRREFVQVLGAGLLITVSGEIALAQQRRGGRGGGGRGGFGGRGPANIAARLHIDRDGTITVMTSKVEVGQGLRAEITQAAAEELRLDPAHVRLIMADTALTPDDGMTAGSGSTPRTVPSVRSGAAAARAARRSGRQALEHGPRRTASTGRRDHAGSEKTQDQLRRTGTGGRFCQIARPADSGQCRGRAGERVEGDGHVGIAAERSRYRYRAHHYPSDIVRPGMLFGKILRPPSFNATLESIDLAAARGDAGRDSDARGLAGRMCGGDELCGPTSGRDIGHDRKMEDQAADFQQGTLLALPQHSPGVDGRRV